MNDKPAARLDDSTVCPLPGHGSNSIVGGSPDVFFDHRSATHQSDAAAYGVTLNANIIANVLISGESATVISSVDTHDSLAVGGVGMVLIGNGSGDAPVLALTPPKLCPQCLLLAARCDQTLVPLESPGGVP